MHANGGNGQRSIPVSRQHSASQGQVRRRLLSRHQTSRSASRRRVWWDVTGDQDTCIDGVRTLGLPQQPTEGPARRTCPLPRRTSTWTDVGVPVWRRGTGSLNVRHRRLLSQSDYIGASVHQLRSDATWTAGNKGQVLHQSMLLLLLWSRMLHLTQLIIATDHPCTLPSPIETVLSRVKKRCSLILPGVVLAVARWSKTFWYRIQFWLMWCKNYRIRSRFSKVVAKVYCPFCGSQSIWVSQQIKLGPITFWAKLKQRQGSRIRQKILVDVSWSWRCVRQVLTPSE